MPKEVIVSDVLAEGGEGYETRVEVRWGRGTDVQIGTTCGRDLSFGVLYDVLTELREQPEFGFQAELALDDDRIRQLAAIIEERTRNYDGWWVDLDRNKINSLIRHLRRGRDQAYGADA